LLSERLQHGRDEEINYRYTQPLTRTCINDPKTGKDSTMAAAMERLLKKIKTALGDLVKDVRDSSRLADRPLGPDAADTENPAHPILTKLAPCQDEPVIEDTSRLFLEQALLVGAGS
jgi:HSP90 family molecular chaperone